MDSVYRIYCHSFLFCCRIAFNGPFRKRTGGLPDLVAFVPAFIESERDGEKFDVDSDSRKVSVGGFLSVARQRSVIQSNNSTELVSNMGNRWCCCCAQEEESIVSDAFRESFSFLASRKSGMTEWNRVRVASTLSSRK